jgi:cobalt-zinc-cadmium efflux system outer membrane protein
VTDVLHPVEVRPSCMVIALAFSLIASASLAADAELPRHEHEALPVDESLTMTAAVDAAFVLFPTTLELAARTEQANAWTDRGQSWLADRPSLSFRYQSDHWGPDNGLDEYEAGINLPLWSWGGRNAVKNLGDTLSAESAATGLALRWEIAGHIRRTLWGIALAENDHELAEQALSTAARLTASVERRYELGDVALSDVLLAQSSFLEAQIMQIEVTAALLDAERAYRSVTGLERRPPFLTEVLSQSHEVEPDHPAIALANAEVRRAEASLAVAEKTFKTGASLLIGSRSERAAFGTAFDDSFGVTVNIPFGGSSHQQTEVSAVSRDAAKARAVRSQKMRALTLDLHEAAHSLNVVSQNLAAASERMDLAERHQTMSESAYEKGELELIDLLKVQATAIAAKRQVTRLLIDQKRQTAFYNQAVGIFP